MSIIEQTIKKSETVLKELKTERDNLEVKLHLFNMEAKEEWDELEEKYEQFKTKAAKVTDATEDSAGEVAEAIKLVGEELREGYKRIKNSM